MAEYFADDGPRARHFIEAILEGERSFGGDLQDGLSVADLQEDAIEFRSQLALLDEIGAPSPCLSVGREGQVPASLRHLDPVTLVGPSETLAAALRDLADDGDQFGTMPTSLARDSFYRRSIDFLAARFAGLRAWRDAGDVPMGMRDTVRIRQTIGGPLTDVVGCRFIVTTDTPHLSVVWSGAYFISPKSFGHPTSPVSGTMQAGTYVFGVAGGVYGNTPEWGARPVPCILPGRPTTHLHF